MKPQTPYRVENKKVKLSKVEKTYNAVKKDELKAERLKKSRETANQA